ncbi:MAG: hypothetical protein JST28_09130 [Acidobacteria bacterium]|nr:hypothetical protein [Acidobacteriota bacterium]
MSAKGFRVAESGHVVNALPPVDITGGKTSQAIDMALAGHVSFILQLGVSAAAPGAVTVQAGSATAAVGSNVTGATAIPFRVYKQETAGAANDVLDAGTDVTAAGFTPSANDGIFYVIEVDAEQLPAGKPYVQLALANTSNSVIASAVAILSGLRYAGLSNPTVTA